MNAATTEPAPQSSLDRVIGLGLAVTAFIWHALLMTRATNDNFLHLTFAQQWLHGDWPVRDFFDQGWVLEYSLSAAAQLLFGDRLVGEAIVVGLAWAIGTFLVFATVRRLTGSLTPAALAALLPIVASARGYSYPKGIVYAVAAWLWWRYLDRPTPRLVVAFGAWVATAFLWRPDHGVYVAIGLVLAVIAAHGVTGLAVRRGATAAATTIVCLLPFLLYVQLCYGLMPYVQAGLAQAQDEHAAHGTHEWPLLRYASQLIAFEPAERFAPTIGLRWNRSSSTDEHEAIRTRYGLTSLGIDRDGVEHVRLSNQSISQVRALINEPLIDDTAGIDRSAGTLSGKDWPSSPRWKFSHAWLRMQVLPNLDARTRASEIVGALFLALPIALIAASRWVSQRLSGPPPVAFALFGVFGLLVAWAMIRNPLPARVADAVVLSAIALGCGLGSIWCAVDTRPVSRIVLRLVVLTVAVATVAVTAVSGEFESPLAWYRGASATARELTASPPLAFYLDRPARFSLRLAAYVRDCVPADERVLVLWFEPEIYYFSDRLMAQRHAVFAPTWSAVETEQRTTLAKIERFRPPIVLARASALDRDARATYPRVVDYVMTEYELSNRVEDAGEEYLIYTRRDRPALRASGHGWPCFTPHPSQWSRVGLTE